MAQIPSSGSPGSRTTGNPDGSSDTITFGSNAFPAPNAMVFDGAGNLYISDSFQGSIYRVANATTCATPTCPVETISQDPLLATAGFPPFGANGLLFEHGRLWVAANQADQVVALNERGRVIAKAGEFEGFRRDGTPRGLLFPASMVIVDGWMYVANLALPLTPMAGDEPEEDVTRWTVSRFRVPR